MPTKEMSPDMVWTYCPDCGRLMTMADIEWHQENQCSENAPTSDTEEQ